MRMTDEGDLVRHLNLISYKKSKLTLKAQVVRSLSQQLNARTLAFDQDLISKVVV